MEILPITSVDEYIEQLSELLIEVVEGAASIGFLPPISIEEANAYWQQVLSPEVVLFIAKIDGRVAGTVQLHLCTKQNGTHRAEIAKLMTGSQFRRKGIARSLMDVAENTAIQEGRSLLVLDTRAGDPSNLLYQSLGYIQVGEIPYFAQSASGELDSTVIYYKRLES